MSEHFKGGQAAKLFPFYKKVTEDQITSIFFAVVELIHPFRDALLKSLGQKSYKNGGDFDCTIRPSIGGKLTSKDIPDALIVLNQRAVWKALVEVKIGSSDLDQAQLGRYLNRAIDEKVNGLVTISNEMCISPNQPPLRLKQAEKRLRKIPHFHWSWRFIKYTAEICLNASDLDNLSRTLLRQFVDLLDSDAGIHGYHSMPKCWPKFVDTLKDGGRPSDEDKDKVISGWFQEIADICIILSEIFNGEVELVNHQKTPELNREAADNLLESESDLAAKFKLPNGKSLSMIVDINSRVIKFETSHLPTDKVKSSSKQIEKFLDSFKDSTKEGEWGDHSDIRLFARWKRQQRMTDYSMSDAMSDYQDDILKHSKLIMPDKDLSQIRIQYTPSGSARAIKSSKNFIEFLESQIKFFAETYVQH